MGSLGVRPFQKTLKTTLVKWRAVLLAALLVSSFALPVSAIETFSSEAAAQRHCPGYTVV